MLFFLLRKDCSLTIETHLRIYILQSFYVYHLIALNNMLLKMNIQSVRQVLFEVSNE